MRFAKTLVALFFSAGVCMPSVVHAQQTDESKDSLPKTAQSKAREFRKMATQVVTSVPDGADLAAKDFDTIFGEETAATLRSAGITKVSRQADHYRVELAAKFEFDVKSIHVKFQPVLEFDFAEGQDSLTFTNIKGVEVNKLRFLRHSDLKSFTLGEDASGNIVVNAHVKMFGFIPRNVEVKIGPDGKPVVK